MIRPPQSYSSAGRDAGLRRLRLANRVAIGGAVALTALLTDVAANAFPGHRRATHAPVTAPARSSGATTTASPAASSQTVPPAIAAPAQAPAPPVAAPAPVAAPPVVVSGGS